MKQAIRTWSFGCHMLEYHVMERSLSGEICDVDHCHIWSNNDVMVRSYGAVVSLGVCWFSTFSSLTCFELYESSFSCRRCHLQQTSTVWFFQISALDLLSVGVRTCIFSEINAGRTPDVSHCCGASKAWWTPQWCPSWATWWTCATCLSMEASMPLLMWLSAWALRWVSQRMSWSNAIKNQEVRLHYFRKNNAITQYCCFMCLTTVSLLNSRWNWLSGIHDVCTILGIFRRKLASFSEGHTAVSCASVQCFSSGCHRARRQRRLFS